MKKFLLIFMACCMMFPLLAGCNNSGNSNTTTIGTTEEPPDETTTEAIPEETTTEAEIEETDPPKEQLVLLENKATTYKIITPKDATHYITDAVTEFAAAVNTKFEATFTVSDDTVENLAEGQAYESDATEILVGATNRKESQEVLATLNDNEYKICVMGNKLVLIGKNEYLTSLAVKDFAKQELAGDDNAKLSVDIDLTFVGKNTANTIGDTDATVRIMTFNVRGSEDMYLSRIPKIINVINRYQPDIVCFQECNKNMHNNMIRSLTKYSVAYATHEGTTTAVYTPILYRKDKFELVDAGSEWLDSRYTKTNTKSIGWAVLKNNANGETFGVVNIHGSLWGTNYDLPEGKTHEEMYVIADTEWKADNVRQMYDRMQKIIQDHGDIAVLWTGDFNFGNDHAAFKKATDEYNMIDSEISATDATDPEIKTYHPTGVRNEPAEGKSIDHILGNSKVTFRIHNVCDEETDEVECSDHYAVFADVKINP